MVAARPYGTHEAVLAASDESCRTLGTDDWLEAFAHHPRIGENAETQKDPVRAGAQTPLGDAWSTDEQAGVGQTGQEVRAGLSDVNREYERRFGYIYIVCATGKSAEEMLEIARGRLANHPAIELSIAAEEQRKITCLRLDKLLAQEEKA